MSETDRLTDEAFEAAQFLYKHGDLTYSAARAAVSKLTDNGFTIRRASQAAPAPSDRLVSVGKASGLVEARASLAARQIRQTLRDYGHRCAETSLPELIATDVDAALRKQEEIHAPAPSDGLREALATLLVQANGVEPRDDRLRQNVVRIARAALAKIAQDA